VSDVWCSFRKCHCALLLTVLPPDFDPLEADKQADGESRSRPDGSRPSEDGEYQRDSLEYIRQTQFQTESRRNSTGGNRVVYGKVHEKSVFQSLSWLTIN